MQCQAFATILYTPKGAKLFNATTFFPQRHGLNTLRKHQTLISYPRIVPKCKYYTIQIIDGRVFEVP